MKTRHSDLSSAIPVCSRPSLLGAASFASSGCAQEERGASCPEESATAELRPPTPRAKADRPSISFTTFNDTLPGNGVGEVRKLFTTAASYRYYFGHSAPASVNFAAGDWVMLSHDAGRGRACVATPASIRNIRRSDSGSDPQGHHPLRARPRRGCLVTLALTPPLRALAQPAPDRATHQLEVQYRRDDVRA